MALKTVVDDIADVAEPLREHYTAKDGKHYLTLDGEPPGFVRTEKVAEFRNRNTDLIREIEPLRALAKTLEGLDPATIAENKAKAAELETTKAQLATATTDLATERAARTAAQAKADASLLRDIVTSKALKVGARPDAIDIIVDKFSTVFGVVGDAVKAKDGTFSKEKPGDPLGVDEWIANAIREFPFLWKGSGGGGAAPRSSLFRGSGGSGGNVLVNPTAKQLGDPATAEAIRTGKLKVEYTT